MITKTLLKMLFSLTLITALTACAGKNIEGTWTEPIPGMINQKQGLQLEKNGKAHSVNMATLQYEQWEMKDNMLILSGKSIGNGQTIPFTETFLIEKLTDDELILKQDDIIFRYHRQ